MAELKNKWKAEGVAALQEKLGLPNRMQVPKLLKIAINMGFNSSLDKDTIKALVDDLARLSGQKPVVTRSRKSISNFKLRKGMPVGARVTLRGDRMYDFLERLIHAALPRIRDFRGLPAGGFDGRGSYSFGLQEQTVFPEIDPDSIKRAQGMNVTLVTSARRDEDARELLSWLGLPLAKSAR